ncbi:hypothetical protein AAV35_000430 [Salimicrobium jeotgali]|uniref:Glutaredoxin domain-containing protein n=2 Tax=Salimicrobium jeotgali TaxID=1230341 RepID=A0AAC8PP79_9BACI|nr:glutaredoxin domain-containing protein [Salimicrobium jeotgali]AKG03397.1 hypothetical protein AAV35_000430 [Salimicrobium jeotgali]
MNQPKIYLYGSLRCIHCENAKKWLKDNGFNYEYMDVDKLENINTIKSYNVNVIPFILIKYPNGTEKHFVGFKEDDLLKTLT